MTKKRRRCRERDAITEERKRFNLWLKISHESVCEAKRHIRDDHPLSAIVSLSVAILELKKVKYELQQRVRRG